MLMRDRNQAVAGTRETSPSVLRHRWLGERKGIWPVETRCWYSVGSDPSGAVHLLEFQSAPSPPPSSLCCIKIHNGMPFWDRLTPVRVVIITENYWKLTEK